MFERPSNNWELVTASAALRAVTATTVGTILRAISERSGVYAAAVG